MDSIREYGGPRARPISNEYRFGPDEWSGEPMTTRIVYAIASIEHREPDEVDVCLFDHVDPDALNRLFPEDATDATALDRVIVALPAHTIQLCASGTIIVRRE